MRTQTQNEEAERIERSFYIFYEFNKTMKRFNLILTKGIVYKNYVVKMHSKMIIKKVIKD